MDPNEQWADFITLLALDEDKPDAFGAAARQVRIALRKYMDLRFGTTSIEYLVDIVNDPAIIAAVKTSLQHVNEDAAAIKTAVDALMPQPPSA